MACVHLIEVLMKKITGPCSFELTYLNKLTQSQKQVSVKTF